MTGDHSRTDQHDPDGEHGQHAGQSQDPDGGGAALL
jgi:hypothetical protein